jgi:hypothetical protein
MHEKTKFSETKEFGLSTTPNFVSLLCDQSESAVPAG